jgi:uncharacterized repeat protein (TIGR02543 family)
MIKFEKNKCKNEKGITLIALVITIVILIILATVTLNVVLGEGGLIERARFAAFATKVRQYQEYVNMYVLEQQLAGASGDINITVMDKDKIKEIIPGISDEDAEKYVIQENEIRYNPDTVTDQEEIWLIQLGILAMTAMAAVFTVTYMVNGLVYQTVQGETITFPEIDPTSSTGNFAGWYYEQEGNREAVEGTQLTEDITLYAKWGEYIATFMSDGEIYDTIEGNSLTFPATNPSKDGYEFMGWFYDENKENEATEGENLTKNTTLYAGWTQIQYDTVTLGTGGYSDGLAYGDNENGNFSSNMGYSEEEGLWYGYLEGIYIRKIMMKYKDGAIKYELLSCTGDFEEYNPYLDENGNLTFQNDFPWKYFTSSFSIKVTYANMEVKVYEVNFNDTYIYCLAEGTLVTLADRSRKAIEDITYEDKLLVWDFDNGCFAEAQPLWIKKRQVAEEYNLVKFDNGVELKTVADHRIFNMEAQKFTYTMNEEDTPIGTTTFMEDGTTAKLIAREVVKETVNYYNIITDYHMNLFANGILTSLRLNNLYKIENMKFVKDNRELVSREEFASIPDKYFYGLRLAEQPKEINRGNDVKHTNTLTEYVERIMKIEK